MFYPKKTFTVFAIILLFSMYKTQLVSYTTPQTTSLTTRTTARQNLSTSDTAVSTTKKSNGSIISKASGEICFLAILTFFKIYNN